MLKENLLALRTAKQLSQTKVATMLNITRQAYNHYETGARIPPTDTIEKLANIFDVSTDYLLGRENEQKKIRSSEEERILKMLYESDELRELIDTAARLTPVELKALSDFVAVRSAELSKEHHE